MRIGHGYDAHRLIQGRKLILGGVEIPYDFGLQGHSDADVLVHALIDALLGAAAMGDIGKLFPDTDDKLKGVDSLKLLREVIAVIDAAGYLFGNADCTLIAEKPKLAPYIMQMRKNLACVLDTSIENISVKATSEEQMGFTGSCEGISAHAVALIFKK